MCVSERENREIENERECERGREKSLLEILLAVTVQETPLVVK